MVDLRKQSEERHRKMIKRSTQLIVEMQQRRRNAGLRQRIVC